MLVTLILSIILIASLSLITVSAITLIQSKKLSASMPKDIQKALLEHDERFRGARALGWLIFIVGVLAFPCAYIYAGWDGIQNGYSLWMFFARFLTMLYLTKAFDIIVLDWFMITKTHFIQHFFPETEGCEGFHKFGFNRKEQLIRIAMFPLISLLLAWICTLL